MGRSRRILLKHPIRNLQILGLATAVLTTKVHPVRGDIVRENVFFYYSTEAHSAPHAQSKPTVKADMEGTFKESVEWLIKYLQ
jgi:hypothetical protein